MAHFKKRAKTIYHSVEPKAGILKLNTHDLASSPRLWLKTRGTLNLKITRANELTGSRQTTVSAVNR